MTFVFSETVDRNSGAMICSAFSSVKSFRKIFSESLFVVLTTKNKTIELVSVANTTPNTGETEMIATATTIKNARKTYNAANGSSIYMTAREFAQIAHNLDKQVSDWAYTPCGEKWGWSDISNVWVRVCESGYKAAFKANGR